MRAIVLAAGEGSRLEPLTRTKPKAMVRVANRPIVEYVLDALVENGVTDVTLVVGYRKERVQNYLGDGKRMGCDISYAFQGSLLGTAHALAQVDFGDEDALVLAGDNIVDAGLVEQVLEAGPGPTLAAHRSRDPSKYGVLTLDGEDVVEIQEKPTTHASEFVNTGVYRFPREFSGTVREGVKDGYTGLTHLLQREIEEGRSVRAVRSDGLWMDAVYPWDLLDLTAHLQDDGATEGRPTGARVHGTASVEALLGRDASVGPQSAVTPSTTVGDNVTIGPGCIVQNCIIYDDVQVGAGTVLRNTVVGEGARLGARVTVHSGPAQVQAAGELHDLDDFGAVVGEDARIGGGATLEPGAMVGVRAEVGLGARVRGRVPDETRVI